jgi:hypothetical protein
MSIIGRTIDDYLNKSYNINCLAICHGKKHSKKFLNKFNNIDPIDQWFYIDIDGSAEPDVVVDASKQSQIISSIPSGSFDIIAIIGCPVLLMDENHLIIVDIIKNFYKTLKPYGKIYISNLPNLSLKMTPRDEPIKEYNDLMKTICTQENDDYFESKMCNLNRVSSDKNTWNYYNIETGIVVYSPYNMEKKILIHSLTFGNDKTKELMLKFVIEFTDKLIKRYGFSGYYDTDKLCYVVS